jgi:hypothetical protein
MTEKPWKGEWDAGEWTRVTAKKPKTTTRQVAVAPFEQRLICECDTEMVFTGRTRGFAEYVHRCPNCNEEAGQIHRYPRIIHLPIEQEISDDHRTDREPA